LERRDHLLNSDVRTIDQFGLSPVAPVSVPYSSTYDMVHGILESESQIQHAVSSGPETARSSGSMNVDASRRTVERRN